MTLKTADIFQNQNIFIFKEGTRVTEQICEISQKDWIVDKLKVVVWLISYHPRLTVTRYYVLIPHEATMGIEV